MTDITELSVIMVSCDMYALRMKLLLSDYFLVPSYVYGSTLYIIYNMWLPNANPRHTSNILLIGSMLN